jgi:metallo-beta-lactamase family protein
LLIISYQAEGSLGRKLFDGVKSVFIDDRRVKVNAKVSAIGSYSSHADNTKLPNWLKKMKPARISLAYFEL